MSPKDKKETVTRDAMSILIVYVQPHMSFLSCGDVYVQKMSRTRIFWVTPRLDRVWCNLSRISCRHSCFESKLKFCNRTVVLVLPAILCLSSSNRKCCSRFIWALKAQGKPSCFPSSVEIAANSPALASTASGP
jgi:hypothetical protein